LFLPSSILRRNNRAARPRRVLFLRLGDSHRVRLMEN
jgi:hypothetical protein